MSLVEIKKRYGELAESDCCLSCGGAINYAEPQLSEVCVDMGSGRGTDAIRMAEKVGPDGFVFGVDISDGMLEKARYNAERLNVTNINFVQCELEKLELPNETANLLISNCTINHASDKQKVWHEIYRVLKDGGRFVVSDIYSVDPVPYQYKNDPVAVAECWAGAVTREEYINNLKDAGFASFEIREESSPYSKGEVNVVSWTIYGMKQSTKKCCCCG